MARLIAFLFAAAAALKLWLDWQATVDAGETFSMATLGEVWTSFSPTTLASVQNAASGFLSADAQAGFLNVPAAAILIVASALFWFFGRKPAPKRKQFGR